jgi:cytochrome c553
MVTGRPDTWTYFYFMSLSFQQRSSIGLFGLVVIMAVPSCKHGKCEDGGSSSGGRESHNAGANCRSCHHPDGEGEVCWNVSGTLYDTGGNEPVQGARVRLFGKPQGKGSEVLALESDRNGNVYTSQEVNFGSGLFPAVINANGDTAFMTEAIRDGACNRCHGQSTEVIKLP